MSTSTHSSPKSFKEDRPPRDSSLGGAIPGDFGGQPLPTVLAPTEGRFAMRIAWLPKILFISFIVVLVRYTAANTNWWKVQSAIGLFDPDTNSSLLFPAPKTSGGERTSDFKALMDIKEKAFEPLLEPRYTATLVTVYSEALRDAIRYVLSNGNVMKMEAETIEVLQTVVDQTKSVKGLGEDAEKIRDLASHM